MEIYQDYHLIFNQLEQTIINTFMLLLFLSDNLKLKQKTNYWCMNFNNRCLYRFFLTATIKMTLKVNA